MEVGCRAKVLAGRNRGEVGTITSYKDGFCFVDFERNIQVDEGFGSTSEYPDGYWVHQSAVEEQPYE